MFYKPSNYRAVDKMTYLGVTAGNTGGWNKYKHK
jgi:hypothetical protein